MDTACREENLWQRIDKGEFAAGSDTRPSTAIEGGMSELMVYISRSSPLQRIAVVHQLRDGGGQLTGHRHAKFLRLRNGDCLIVDD